MKIKTLIQKLNKLNQEAEVILSSDTEGNSYDILNQVYHVDGLKYSTDYDNGHPTLFSKDDIDEDIPGSEYKKMKACIILYPS